MNTDLTDTKPAITATGRTITIDSDRIEEVTETLDCDEFTAPTPPAPDKGGDIREPREPYLASLIRLCDDDDGRITSHIDMAIRTLVAEVRRLRGVDEELRVRIAALREDVAAVTEDLALIREARRHVPDGLAYPGLVRLLSAIDDTAGGAT